MKKLFFAIFVLLFSFVLTIGVFAKSKEFNITIPKGYEYSYADESNEKIKERLDMSKEELADYFSENKVELLAVNEDLTKQIKVCVYEDKFSKSVENFSRLSENDLKEIAEKMVDDTDASFDVCSVNNRKYIKLSENLKDSGGDFVSTQFITVSSGKLYNVAFSNKADFADDNDEVMNTFNIVEESKISAKTIIITVIFALFIAGFTALIVVMIIGIFKDKKKSQENEIL